MVFKDERCKHWQYTYLLGFSESWLLDARGLLEDHLDAILQAHPLERLLALQVILLVNLVQVLDLLAPLVLFF